MFSICEKTKLFSIKIAWRKKTKVLVQMIALSWQSRWKTQIIQHALLNISFVKYIIYVLSCQYSDKNVLNWCPFVGIINWKSNDTILWIEQH